MTDKKRRKHKGETSIEPIEAAETKGDPPTPSQTPVTPPPARSCDDSPYEPALLGEAQQPSPHRPHGARR